MVYAEKFGDIMVEEYQKAETYYYQYHSEVYIIEVEQYPKNKNIC